MSRKVLVAIALSLCACGGGGSESSAPAGNGPVHGNGAMEAPPQAKTEAVLVGPLCKGDRCACKQGDADAGHPESRFKRYEVHIGPSDDLLWVTVDGMVLYKSQENAEACFYIDLEPGVHKVALRGKSADKALSAAATISEQGGTEGQTWWYHTFDFNCGAPGECTLQDVESWKSEIAKWKGKHDPCGSTKIQDLSWETGRMPDRLHPDDLLVHFALDVYKFTPKNPPGSTGCDKGGHE